MQDVLIRAEPRFGGGERSGRDQGLRHRMIERELMHVVAANEVGPAIAEVGDVYLAVAEQGDDDGGPHAPAFGLGATRFDDGVVGFVDGSQDRVFRRIAGGQPRMHGAGNDLDRHAAGDLAAILSAHSVRDDEKSQTEIGDEAVFVVGTHALGSASSRAQGESNHASSGINLRYHDVPVGIGALYAATGNFAKASKRR